MVGLNIPLRSIFKPSYSGNITNPNVVGKAQKRFDHGMNNRLKTTFKYLGFIIILCSCGQENKKYIHDIGYVDPNTASGDKDFKTCRDEIYEYYNSEPDGGYKHGKKALRDSVLKKYSASVKESGYLTFRFVVNCEGKAGRYMVIQNNLDLEPKVFDEDLTSQLLTITQGLKEWRPVVLENVSRDYYMYITYKMLDGKIIEILP